MNHILGLGNTSPLQQSQKTKTQDPQKQTGELGHRPPPPNFDRYTMSQEATSTMSVMEEEETLLDYMAEEAEAQADIDYEALGVSEEDMDFSEFEEFSNIDQVDAEAPSETVPDSQDVTESDLDAEVQLDPEVEDSESVEDVEDSDEVEDVEDSDEVEDSEDVEDEVESESALSREGNVHGYLRSLTAEDLEMLSIAFQANQMLTLEGSTLFDYLDGDSSWFDTDWNTGASTSTDSSFDFDSWLEDFNALTGDLSETEGEDSDDTVQDSDVLDEVVDSEVPEETISEEALAEEATAEE